MSQLFISGGQSIGVSASTSVLPMNTPQQITEEIKKEIKICIEMNENENTITQNLWDTVKAVLRYVESVHQNV